MVRAWGGMVVGIRGILVEVEADVSSGGLPSFTLVGLPDAAVRESRERVLSALRHSGLALPPRRVTVNLAPGNVHKAGPALDLPIAVGLATGAGHLPPGAAGDTLLVGELSLGGDLKAVRGILSIVLAARDAGRTAVIVPAWNAEQAALVPGVTVLAARTLAEVVEHLATGRTLAPFHEGPASTRRVVDASAPVRPPDPPALDLAHVRGQHVARRALEIAAVGRHNVLFIGPPGAGKTLLASRLPGLLPPLDREEALEVTQIHSVVGGATRGLVRERPFRAPHHTISDAGLVGGGEGPRPGELSLAHRGVLFLDELPEFRRSALEALRQPLEEGVVRIVRTRGLERFPADFQLVAAMNPCPCGLFGDPARACRCAPGRVLAYRSRVSGPLLDRIDLYVHMPPLTAHEMGDGPPSEASAAVRGRVLAARRFRASRETAFSPAAGQGRPGLAQRAGALLARAVDRLGLSARGYDRTIRIARSIADLAGSEPIAEHHVAEALAYRRIDPPYAADAP